MNYSVRPLDESKCPTCGASASCIMPPQGKPFYLCSCGNRWEQKGYVHTFSFERESTPGRPVEQSHFKPLVVSIREQEILDLYERQEEIADAIIRQFGLSARDLGLPVKGPSKPE